MPNRVTPAGLRIERVPIGDLVVDPSNVRLHPQRNLEAIKGSLAKFGQQEPIIVGPNNVVVAGNGRLDVAREMGWTHIDIVRTNLTGADVAAYSIASNRTAETASWDEAGLAALLQSLPTLDGTGFDQGDLDALLASLPDPDSHPYGRHFPADEMKVQCPKCGHRFNPEAE